MIRAESFLAFAKTRMGIRPFMLLALVLAIPTGSHLNPNSVDQLVQAKTTDIRMIASDSVAHDYISVHGMQMYYETHGIGPTVVLLHGGTASIQLSFDRQIPILARSHRVLGLEQMGHGHTADNENREFSYEGMAEDTAEALKILGVQKADLIGWSDGGQIALRLAFTHPELVRRVVVSGVGLGSRASGEENLPRPYENWTKPFHDEYVRVSPDGPGHWSVLFERIYRMWTKRTWGFSVIDLAKIRASTLVVAGDRDLIPIEETLRIFRSIPDARLFIVPGTGHWTFRDRPDWVNPAILEFLDHQTK